VASMPHTRPSPPRPPRARGAVTWVTLLLLLAIAGGGYAAWVFGPALVLHYEVKQVVRDFGHRAVKDQDDAGLVLGMVQKLRTLQDVDGVDEAGRRVRVPMVDLRTQDVTWERSANPARLHVAFEYARDLELPFLHRTLPRVYRVDETIDIARPVW
jgi:hypothetical protein